jgi:hypothetical protein
MGLKPRPKLILGWREWIQLPELCDAPIKAKVDTGARTSALHAENVRLVRRGARRFARFVVIPTHAADACEAIAPLIDVREVRSSNGAIERRPVIAAQLAIGGRVRTIELSLTDRDTMGFRLLLGRQAIRQFRATVDPLRSFATSS